MNPFDRLAREPELPLDPADFSAYYRYTPAALALRECVRLRIVRQLDLPAPVLDVGCGDGLFARLAHPDRSSWGIDINPDEVSRAQGSAAYKTLVCGSIVDVDLPQGFFGSAIANCSLEHVPDIHGALLNIKRSLRPGATFALIVPTPEWTQYLAVPSLLRRAGLRGLAMAYGEALDQVFSHIHLYDEAGWTQRLERAGLTDVRATRFVGAPASWAFDALLYPSLVGWATKKVTGRWVLSPLLRPLSVDLVRRLIDTAASLVPEREGGGEILLVCRRPEQE